MGPGETQRFAESRTYLGRIGSPPDSGPDVTVASTRGTGQTSPESHSVWRTGAFLLKGFAPSFSAEEIVVSAASAADADASYTGICAKHSGDTPVVFGGSSEHAPSRNALTVMRTLSCLVGAPSKRPRSDPTIARTSRSPTSSRRRGYVTPDASWGSRVHARSAGQSRTAPRHSSGYPRPTGTDAETTSRGSEVSRFARAPPSSVAPSTWPLESASRRRLRATPPRVGDAASGDATAPLGAPAITSAPGGRHSRF